MENSVIDLFAVRGVEAEGLLLVNEGGLAGRWLPYTCLSFVEHNYLVWETSGKNVTGFKIIECSQRCLLNSRPGPPRAVRGICVGSSTEVST